MQLKSGIFVAMFSCAFLYQAARGVAAEEPGSALNYCESLSNNGDLMFEGVSVKGTGKRCLAQDLLQKSRIDLINGRERGSPGYLGVIGFLRGHDLDLDLKGHLVSGAPFEGTTGITADDSAIRIRVHDGVVRTPGGRSLGVSLGPNKDPRISRPMRLDDPPMEMVKGGSIAKAHYQRSEFAIDRLSIQSGGLGVSLVGDGNSLRNSTIETDGSIAAYIYGPNAVIENNTFIVNVKAGDSTELPAALKLRDATGAIVRNNRFIVKGAGNLKASAAVNLLESQNVLIENNVVERTQTLVRKDRESSTSESGNTLKP